MNAVEIEEAVSDLVARYAAEGFDPENFPFDFLEAFGNPAATLKRLRTAGKSSTNQSDVGGVLQARNIHLRVCEPGQVNATLRELLNSPETAKRKCKFALATDGVTVEAEHLDPGSAGAPGGGDSASGGGETLACDFADLPDRFAFFLELAGIRTVRAIRENAFDVKATGRLNKLYLELIRHNPDWGTDARRRDMNHFMARLIFCFFAEDTGIFTGDGRSGDGLFTATVQQMSDPDASNTHDVIAECFRAINVTTRHHGKPDGRHRDAANIRPYANTFPYVNGGLFGGCRDSTDVPRFTRIARSYLLHVGSLDWTKINPDIFGSMIQAVADDAERGALGMHYTSVPNILKVLNPLFLDDLRQKLDDAGDPRTLDNGAAAGSKRKLLNLRNRLARVRVFDPACGSGNFLVIAYKEMRAIEAEVNARRGEKDRPSDIPLTNFRGIELRHFAAEVARLALIIAEYQCDALHRGEKLALAEFLPLGSDNWITCGNALRLDWHQVMKDDETSLPRSSSRLFTEDDTLEQQPFDFENEGGETYICGNPPYKGSQSQTKDQKADLSSIFSERTENWKSLDYVSGWFMKAADYGQQTLAEAAFVSTNSICQGRQVDTLWSLILQTEHEIKFAHTSFKWANLASHNAGVTVVIVGLSRNCGNARKLFFEGDDGSTAAREAANINPYLSPAATIIIDSTAAPLAELSEMSFGNMPNDGGLLLLTPGEAREAVEQADVPPGLIHPFLGSQEFIRGIERRCIWVADDEVAAARSNEWLRKRFAAVEAKRAESSRETTRNLSQVPYRFGEVRQTGSETVMLVPRVSSESRDYLPIGYCSSGTIASDAAFALYDAPLWNLAIIASKLHLVWVATVCGKLKTDYRYSNTLGWNTFPVPALTEGNRAELTECAQGILLAREGYWPATIAEMYDPRKMDADYPDLRRAHDRNDETLERIYLGRRFKNDTERLEHLFQRYTDLTAPPSAAG